MVDTIIKKNKEQNWNNKNKWKSNFNVFYIFKIYKNQKSFSDIGLGPRQENLSHKIGPDP